MNEEEKLLARIATHRAACEKSHRPAYAQLWTAALELKKDMDARARTVRNLEERLLETMIRLVAARKTRTVIKEKPVIIRYPEYEYGTGTWILSALILFIAAMLLANVQWAAGVTALSFWFTVALSFALIGIAGFFIVRTVSQKF